MSLVLLGASWLRWCILYANWTRATTCNSCCPILSFPSPSLALTMTWRVVGWVVVVHSTGLVLLSLKRSARDMWYNLSDTSYCFSSAFSKHHACTGVDKLGILDETKAACGLVPSTKVVFVHWDNWSSLPSATTVDCQSKIIIIKWYPWRWFRVLTHSLVLCANGGWVMKH